MGEEVQCLLGMHCHRRPCTASPSTSHSTLHTRHRGSVDKSCLVVNENHQCGIRPLLLDTVQSTFAGPSLSHYSAQNNEVLYSLYLPNQITF